MAKRHIENRTVMLFGEISESNIAKTIDRIQEILDDDPMDDSPIKIILSSEGGDVYDGFGLIGFIESLPVPIHIHCVGKVMSMALVIAASGDVTTSSAYCTFMYHEISNSIPFQEKIQYHKQESKECERLQKMYDDFLLKHTKFEKALLDDVKIKRSEFYFNPKDALKFGLIEKII